MAALNAVGMVLADTSRSRVYLQALEAHGLGPSHAFVLPSPDRRPGQVGDDAAGRCAVPWGEVDLGRDVFSLLKESDIPHDVLPSADINAVETVRLLATSPCDVFIYSGFGGVILRSPVLNCGKRFLHVHGGFLPDYKGSTTNYYSYLQDGECGASAIFMTDRIDSGPVLHRIRVVPESDLLEMDHVLDSCYRARVLCETLASYRDSGEWPVVDVAGQGRVHYIMHPLLRHVAICKSREAFRG
ncbi:formyltransferase family protein [Pseudodesulfovibrio tunisiensis]|uniref:formyltransferase family protein n=1 Tax=Pseudodesulfovibrio tunisiensis TaxID=463192 RepID=UPI001FB4BC41|nr:formyltransferase family protein [Pseudodesulfovibrio tunisiensis]